LEQIADETKISIRFLKAIEAEDFAQLPGGVYDRSYIRQYAAAVGFDAEELLACYRYRMGLDPADEPKAPVSGRQSKKRFAIGWTRVAGPTRLF
jgi:cytoskeletal protein RodZ